MVNIMIGVAVIEELSQREKSSTISQELVFRKSLKDVYKQRKRTDPACNQSQSMLEHLIKSLEFLSKDLQAFPGTGHVSA